MDSTTRRDFLKVTGLAAAAAASQGIISPMAGSILNAAPVTEKEKFRFGLASYSLRNFSLTQSLQMVKRLGIEYFSMKEVHLPLMSSKEEIEKAAAEIKDAGIKLYAVGVIYMKTEEDVNRAFEYAKTLGAEIIVGVPNHELLAYTEKKVKEYNIKVAIHNHGPKDLLYPAPQDAYEKIKHMDKRMGLCLDIGHAMRIGIDPAEPLKKYSGRILDIHIKDVDKAAAEGTTVEMGRGIIDLPKFFKTVKKLGYKGVMSFEYEKDAKDPFPGISESVGYTRGIFKMI